MPVLSFALPTSPGRWQSLFALTVISVGLAAGPVRGQNSLITINPTTGAGTLVAPLGVTVSPTGLAFRGSNLYIWDNVADRVRELDPTTGATLNSIDTGASISQEGDIVFRGDGVGFLSGGGGNFYVFDLTVPNSSNITRNQNPAMDGLAFNAADVLYGLRENGQALYTIDVTNAATTLVGSTGIPGGFTIGGLAFDSSGNLFAAVGTPSGPSSLYQIDPLTGAATLVGNIGFNGVSGIRFGPTGTLYGITYGAAIATPGISVTESAGATNVVEGGATDTYAVVLNTAPTANVTITINTGAQVAVAPTTLIFTPTNWNTAQTVTVTAVDDAWVEGVHAGTITHTALSTDTNYNGVASAGLTVTITDNDVAPPPPPPPPPSEGGFGNVGGGGEGGFGFGFGGVAAFRTAILDGPTPDGAGYRVRNVGHRQNAQVDGPSSTFGGWGPWLYTMFAAGLVLSAALAVRAGSRVGTR